MGFFAWIREGVRRAVLLGFSDAVTQLGDRSATEDLGPQLAATWQQGIAWDTEARPALAQAGQPARKRLGKSLEEIRNASVKPA